MKNRIMLYFAAVNAKGEEELPESLSLPSGDTILEVTHPGTGVVNFNVLTSTASSIYHFRNDPLSEFIDLSEFSRLIITADKPPISDIQFIVIKVMPDARHSLLDSELRTALMNSIQITKHSSGIDPFSNTDMGVLIQAMEERMQPYFNRLLKIAAARALSRTSSFSDNAEPFADIGIDFGQSVVTGDKTFVLDTLRGILINKGIDFISSQLEKRGRLMSIQALRKGLSSTSTRYMTGKAIRYTGKAVRMGVKAAGYIGVILAIIDMLVVAHDMYQERVDEEELMAKLDDDQADVQKAVKNDGTTNDGRVAGGKGATKSALTAQTIESKSRTTSSANNGIPQGVSNTAAKYRSQKKK